MAIRVPKNETAVSLQRPFVPRRSTAHRRPTALLRRNKAHSRLLQPTATVEMCDTLNDEVSRLAACLNHRHGGSTTTVAVLIYVTTYLFTSYGKAHGADLMPLLAVQRRAVDVFMEREGVGSGTLDKALADLSRANGTVAYMASLPE